MQTPGYVAELSLMVLQVDATLKSSRIASRGKNDATFYFLGICTSLNPAAQKFGPGPALLKLS